MNGTERIRKKSISSTLIRYVFGIFFLLSSVVYFSSSFITGLLFLLAGVIAIPQTAAQLERKLNISMSGTTRFFVVFLLVIAASTSAPQINSPTEINNSADVIAAPLASTNGTTTIEIPESTETPEVTTTPDNKGTLDIVTSPTGASVTVDGVPQGLSPVKRLSVDEGEHIIDLYLSGYNAKTLKVYVKDSDTETIDWAFTPYVEPNPTPTETPEVTPTETPTETSTSEPAETQATTSYSKSTTTSNTVDTNSGLLYASSESDVYHASWCSYVERIKPENLITFDSVKDAEAGSYRACKRCGG